MVQSISRPTLFGLNWICLPIKYLVISFHGYCCIKTAHTQVLEILESALIVIHFFFLDIFLSCSLKVNVFDILACNPDPLFLSYFLFYTTKIKMAKRPTIEERLLQKETENGLSRQRNYILTIRFFLIRSQKHYWHLFTLKLIKRLFNSSR